MRSLDLLLSAIIICWLAEKSEAICQRQNFYEVHNSTHEGKLLDRKGPYPWKECERLCRQYFECVSFSVEWIDQGFGWCTIYNGHLLQEDLIQRQGVSIFLPCPLNFTWNDVSKICYSSEAYPKATWSEAVKECQLTHPAAKLIEPRSQAENEQLYQILVSADIYECWLGIFRPSTSSDVSEFRYKSDGSLITYNNWAASQPDNSKDSENCGEAFRFDNSLTWYDTNCLQEHMFICQV